VTIDLSITTRRLVMRDFVVDDWQAVYACASDPEVVRYTPFEPNTEQESREFVTRCTEEQFRSPRENFQLAVVAADTGLLIGSIGVGLNPSADG
jgi:RimJ/RimL family protein N-acetyltransferase